MKPLPMSSKPKPFEMRRKSGSPSSPDSSRSKSEGSSPQEEGSRCTPMFRRPTRFVNSNLRPRLGSPPSPILPLFPPNTAERLQAGRGSLQRNTTGETSGLLSDRQEFRGPSTDERRIRHRHRRERVRRNRSRSSTRSLSYSPTRGRRLQVDNGANRRDNAHSIDHPDERSDLSSGRSGSDSPHFRRSRMSSSPVRSHRNRRVRERNRRNRSRSRTRSRSRRRLIDQRFVNKMRRTRSRSPRSRRRTRSRSIDRWRRMPVEILPLFPMPHGNRPIFMPVMRNPSQPLFPPAMRMRMPRPQMFGPRMNMRAPFRHPFHMN